MGVIYITENLYNKERGLMPWRYIGSDQHNDPAYLGSSLDLKEDMKNLGKEFFVKRILVDCGDIDNKELRKIESVEYLRPNNVSNDDSYYNKTDRYAPGGAIKKGQKHRTPRSADHCRKIVEHRTGSTKSEASRQLMRDKKMGTKATEPTKKLMSESHSGEKNHNALLWEITCPAGIKYTIKGLRKWCRDNNIDYYIIYHNRQGWSSTKYDTGKNAGRKHLK